MDVFSALNVGVTGLQAQGNVINNISQNVSNADTTGFKEVTTTFADIVNDLSGNNYSVNGNGAPDTGLSLNGVMTGNQQLTDVQGTIDPSNSPTDLAISGSGFFTVSTTATDSTENLEYTRAGSFAPDANGNYINAAGGFLQAWPLNPDGTLPAGLTGVSLNSATGIAALQTVNVQNIISVPVPTTTVAFEANLNAGEKLYPGAGDTAVMDVKDAANYGNSADSIIVPTPIGGTSADQIAQGDSMTVSTGLDPAGTTYTYGGIAFSRSIGSTSVDGSSAAGLQQPIPLTPQTGAGATAAFTFNSSTPTSMTINLGANTPASVGVSQDGQIISLSGTAAAGGLGIDNITNLDGDYTVTGTTTAVNGVGNNTITVTIPSGVTPPSPLALSAGDSFAIASTGAGTSSATLTFASLPAGMAQGDTIEIAGGPTINGASLSGTFTVSNITGNTVTFAIPGNATATGGDTPASSSMTVFDENGNLADTNTAAVNSRFFSGDIMDASSPNQPLITTPANFNPASMSFTITTPSTGTSTFTYTPIAPNAALGQFSTLNTLASAINDVSGLTARVVNNQLYIADVNGDDSIQFNNSSLAGSTTTPALPGIDWVGELGLSDVSSGTNRFSTLQGLANAVNTLSNLTATVNNPLSGSTVKINVDDPLDTITFADGAGNKGSLLGELGLANSLSSGGFIAQTTGPLGPAYNAATPATNMASGAIDPDFDIPVTVVDNAGENHNLEAGFLKTGTNSWAVEVYAQPASDVTATGGQVAAGTITFNSDGTLASISPSLTQIGINWTDTGGGTSNIAFSWGTAGVVGTGMANGVSQFAGANSLTSVQQNGLPINTVTTASVSSSGVISVNYSNGNSRAVYQIPLAEFTNPEQLNVLNSNVYTQSAGSGTLTFLQPGNGGVSIVPDALESSNVDVATQLTNMIIAQNAYQANTKLISTSDQMLQTAVQMDQSISI